MQFHFIAELIGFIASIVTIVTAIVGCVRFIVNRKKSRSVTGRAGMFPLKGNNYTT